jgi:UDP-N-acetylmuramoyl-L-alanyl-D-glutamate--2,6-diaminopimelate ligase
MNGECTLGALLADMIRTFPYLPHPVVTGDLHVVIHGVTDDSRAVQPGGVFVARRGTRNDGGGFIQDAIRRGAVAVVHDAETVWPDDGTRSPVVQLVCPDPRALLGPLVSSFHGHPARRMRLLGVTGTNGKTTTTFMLATILRQHGLATGVIGTTGVLFPDGQVRSNPMTTPGPVALHRLFGELETAGCHAVAMEVSSHALDQQRVAGLSFEVALFTNLTRDHLDYHGEEGHYFAAKARLFTAEATRSAVLNLSDPFGRRLVGMCAGVLPQVWGYAMADDPAAQLSGVPMVTVAVVRAGWQGMDLTLCWPDGTVHAVHLPMAGGFNALNAAAAATAATLIGVAPATIVAGLAQVHAPPGRVEVLYPAGRTFPVVIDYAHTPDALERLLQTARALTPVGRLIVVFGCGGERDRDKRAMMGRIAADHADLVLVTDDNPRHEDPATIRQAILSGGAGRDNMRELPDRAAAIERAIQLAQPGDAVLIAGKGHETVQITADGILPFDDVKIAQAVLAAREPVG